MILDLRGGGEAGGGRTGRAALLFSWRMNPLSSSSLGGRTTATPLKKCWAGECRG